MENDKLEYEAPAIIYEGTLTTRAGSTFPNEENVPDLNPEDLFGGS